MKLIKLAVIVKIIQEMNNLHTNFFLIYISMYGNTVGLRRLEVVGSSHTSNFWIIPVSAINFIKKLDKLFKKSWILPKFIFENFSTIFISNQFPSFTKTSRIVEMLFLISEYLNLRRPTVLLFYQNQNQNVTLTNNQFWQQLILV